MPSRSREFDSLSSHILPMSDLKQLPLVKRPGAVGPTTRVIQGGVGTLEGNVAEQRRVHQLSYVQSRVQLILSYLTTSWTVWGLRDSDAEQHGSRGLLWGLGPAPALSRYITMLPSSLKYLKAKTHHHVDCLPANRRSPTVSVDRRRGGQLIMKQVHWVDHLRPTAESTQRKSSP